MSAMDSMIETLVFRLGQHRGHWPVLAEASGVPVSTLRKIAQGVVKNPRIGTVDKLHKALDACEVQAQLLSAAQAATPAAPAP